MPRRPLINAIVCCLLAQGVLSCDRQRIEIGRSDSGSAADPDAPDAEQIDATPIDGLPDQAAADDASVDAPADVGNPPKCAVAVIDQITPGLKVVPKTSVNLCGDHSETADGGKSKTRRWSIQQQPENSLLQLIPYDTAPCIQVKPEAIGVYRICLEVGDALGLLWCNKKCVDLEVYPPKGIHIELTWQVAGPAPEDGSGADLDLHFAHEKAKHPGIQDTCAGAPYPWFDPLFDAYGIQSALNWGVADPAVLDDPILIDSLDGSAPERLSMAEPEGNLNKSVFYYVGVHYWNDHGRGDAKAKLRVFINGALLADLYRTMKPLEMWTVGKIFWPNAYVGGSFQAWIQCTQLGDPCLDGQAPWQKDGKPCVNYCFKPEGWGGANPPASGDCE